MTSASSSPPLAEGGAPTAAPSLRSRLLSSAFWVTVSAMSGHVLRLVSNLIVTRLLAPEMFGVMAIASTIPVILGLLSDLGLHQSVIRSRRGNEAAFVSTVWTAQIVRGFALWLAALAVAVGLYAANRMGWIPHDSTYAAPDLPGIIALSCFASVIGGFGSLKGAMAERNFDLRRMVVLEISQQVVSLAVMITLAWYTRSIWSLAAAGLASSTVYTVLSHVWLRGVRHRLGWDKEAAREIISFGKWLFLSSAVGVLAMNGDRLLLAGFADAHYLGLYSVAFALVGALDVVLGRIFQSVMLPAFSEVARQDPERVPAAYTRLRKVVDPIVLVASGLMFSLAPLIIGTLYDARYTETGHILSVLSLGMVISRYTMVQQAYLALNRPQYQVVLNIVRLVSTFVLVPLVFRIWGLQGALVAIALRELPILPFVFWFNAGFRLNNFKLELALLAFWPVGWAVGTAVVHGARLAGWH